MLHILILYMEKQISRPHTFKFKLLLTAATSAEKETAASIARNSYYRVAP